MSKHYSKAPQVVEEEEEVYQDKPKLLRLFNKNHKQFLKFNNQNLQRLESKKLSIQEDHLLKITFQKLEPQMMNTQKT